MTEQKYRRLRTKDTETMDRLQIQAKVQEATEERDRDTVLLLHQARRRLNTLAAALQLCLECHQRLPRSADTRYCYATCNSPMIRDDPTPLDPDPHGNLRLAIPEPPTIRLLARLDEDRNRARPDAVLRWPTVAARFQDLTAFILEWHGAPATSRPNRVIGRTGDRRPIALICEAVPAHYPFNTLTAERLEDILHEAWRHRLKPPAEIWATGTELPPDPDTHRLHIISVWPQDGEEYLPEND